MKHVFYIQNYTTFQVVNSLILEEELNKEECIFFFGRGFAPPETTIKSIDLTPFTLSYPIAFWKNWRTVYNNKKAIREIIAQEIQMKYIFYFPFTNLYFVRMICDHKNCETFNCLEDGVSAYWTVEERRNAFINDSLKSFIYAVKIFFTHYFTYFPINIISYWRYYRKGYSKFYTLGNCGFPGIANRVVLTSVKSIKPESELMSIKYLYAPAALVEKNLVTLKTFKNSLVNLFTILRENEEKSIIVHYRFHPLTSMNSKNMDEYQAVFDQLPGINFVELSKHIALEDLLFHTNAALITDISSVAIYAQSFNKKIVSYNEIIASFEPNFRKVVKQQPQKLRNLLKYAEITKSK